MNKNGQYNPYRKTDVSNAETYSTNLLEYNIQLEHVSPKIQLEKHKPIKPYLDVPNSQEDWDTPVPAAHPIDKQYNTTDGTSTAHPIDKQYNTTDGTSSLKATRKPSTQVLKSQTRKSRGPGHYYYHLINSTKHSDEKTGYFMKKVRDAFFYLFDEGEFHPLRNKSYLYNFWYLFRGSFLNIRNFLVLMFGN
ncbi:unnamed protein product [Heterobilharzia americana]|nr:unnamed protein product [Heterobilharzia americana]